MERERERESDDRVNAHRRRSARIDVRMRHEKANAFDLGGVHSVQQRRFTALRT